MNWERDDRDIEDFCIVDSNVPSFETWRDRSVPFEEWWEEFADGPIGSRPFPSKIVTG